MTANDSERLVLVLRLAKRMREAQTRYEDAPTTENSRAMVKAEREFDIAVGALKL